MADVEVTLGPTYTAQITNQVFDAELAIQTTEIQVTTPGPQGATAYTGLIGGNAPDFLFSPESYVAGGTAP